MADDPTLDETAPTGTPLAETPIPARFHARLEAAGLPTREAIEAYLDEHDDLTALEGIGKPSDTEIRASLDLEDLVVEGETDEPPASDDSPTVLDDLEAVCESYDSARDEALSFVGATPVVLKADCTLGEGTRHAGDCLGYVLLEEGVELRELVNALRNPHLITGVH